MIQKQAVCERLNHPMSIFPKKSQDTKTLRRAREKKIKSCPTMIDRIPEVCIVQREAMLVGSRMKEP
nr:hypothetical protein Q903MT_gene2721 [Picea sitchensis]